MLLGPLYVKGADLVVINVYDATKLQRKEGNSSEVVLPRDPDNCQIRYPPNARPGRETLFRGEWGIHSP